LGRATEHRPYWRNQAVGFLLTSAGVVLAFLFVFVTATLQAMISDLQLVPLLERATSYAALRLTAVSLSVAAASSVTLPEWGGWSLAGTLSILIK